MPYPTKKLGEVVKIQSGFGFPHSLQGRVNEKYPFLKVSDMNHAGNKKGITEWSNTVSDEDIKTEGYKVAPEGTVIFPKIGGAISTNKKRILIKPSIYDNNVMGFIPSKNILSEYLYLWLSGFDLSEWASGSSLPAITRSRVSDTKIPLPPLPEQKKIVKKIEELFGKIDEAQKLREEAQADAATLIPAALHQIFEKGKQKRWEEKNLGEVFEKIVGGGTPSKSNAAYWGGNIPWASVKDLKEGNHNLIKTKDFITKIGLENSASNLIPAGTLVISTRMGLGRIAKTKIDLAINQDLKAIFPKKELDNDYLFWFYKSKSNEIVDSGTGATVSGVRLDYIRGIKIPLPPLPEQKKIVAYLDSLSEKAKKLQELQSQTAADLKALKQSILHKAFSGELIK